MLLRTTLLLLVGCGLAAHAETQKFKIDPVHSSVIFKVDHMGWSKSVGQFPEIEGEFHLDDAKADANKVDLKIKVESLTTTTSKKRDDHLKGPDFFNAKANPWITFKSTSIKGTAPSYQVSGNLTMNGVTKPVSFNMKRGRTAEGPDGKVHTGGEGSLTIKRSDYNMKFMNGPNQIGDDVEIMINIEGVRE